MTLVAGLLALIVLLGPILFKPFERNLEVFFLVVGGMAAVAMGELSWPLAARALREPVELSAAVLVFGAIFRQSRTAIDRCFAWMIRKFGHRWLCLGLVLILGLIASVMTAVVAALVLSEAIAQLRLSRRSEILASSLGCFAIGLGASLTPIGEPLSTVVIGSLDADFWYLARLIGPYVMAGILIVALSVLLVRVGTGGAHPIAERESWKLVLLRAGRVYIFIAGLVLLSRALHPTVGAYLVRIPQLAMFWINIISAVLDNATLAAIEIGPGLSADRQQAALLSLLISGGMLIPGNIPNIVVAGRLRIGSREWARAGVPIGLALLVLCFAVLTLMPSYR